MNQKYQVFISSTYEDLREQRDTVVKTVLRMGHLPVGMEMFNAADDTQWEIIKRHIDNSDYYVVILAHRYGSEAPDGMGYTEKEYEYAQEQGVPCLGFIIHDDADWSPKLIAKGEQATKLDVFKGKLKSRMVSFWYSSDNLALLVSNGLSEAFNVKPRIGWVRASEAASPQVAEEIARLSKENGELKAQLEQTHFSDELAIIERAVSLKMDYILVDEITKSVGFYDVFISICELQNRPTQGAILNKFDTKTHEAVHRIIAELELMGLIKRETVPVPRSEQLLGQHILLYLTGIGRRLYIRFRYTDSAN